MDKEKFQTKILFFIFLKSMEEVSKIDEEMQDELEDMDAKIQWRIGDDIIGYLEIKDGKVKGVIDEELDNPDITMSMESLEKARAMFTGELDGTSAYMSGDLKMEGEMAIGMKLGPLAEVILEYLEPIRPSLE